MKINKKMLTETEEELLNENKPFTACQIRYAVNNMESK